jgi:hypothetical protein
MTKSHYFAVFTRVRGSSQDKHPEYIVRSDDPCLLAATAIFEDCCSSEACLAMQPDVLVMAHGSGAVAEVSFTSYNGQDGVLDVNIELVPSRDLKAFLSAYNWPYTPQVFESYDDACIHRQSLELAQQVIDRQKAAA